VVYADGMDRLLQLRGLDLDEIEVRMLIEQLEGVVTPAEVLLGEALGKGEAAQVDELRRLESL
jgi:ribosomal protein L12E/L44/L45/RPP1/RPP2